MQVRFLDPLEKERATTPIFLPGESQGQRSLVGYSPWGHKESDMTKWLSKRIRKCRCLELKASLIGLLLILQRRKLRLPNSGMNMHIFAHVPMHTYTREGGQLSQFSQNCPGFCTENPTPWKTLRSRQIRMLGHLKTLTSLMNTI